MKKLLSQAAVEKNESFEDTSAFTAGTSSRGNHRSETSLMLNILDGISNRRRVQKSQSKNSNSKTKKAALKFTKQ